MTTFEVYDGHLYFITNTVEYGPVATHIKFADNDFQVSFNMSDGKRAAMTIEGDVEYREYVSLDEFNKRNRLEGKNV